MNVVHLLSYLWAILQAEGAGLVPWVGGPPDGCFPWVLPKRSIP